MESLARLEEQLILTLKWPQWALRLIASLSVLVITTGIFQQQIDGEKIVGDSSSKKRSNSRAFHLFQLQYLSVYLITMLADWLQGTNMYTLYTSYGMDVGTLFLTGFLSSAIFGTFLGIFVDEYGRKTGCIVFCLLEIVINLLEHVPSMPALLIGRVLGGMSTSLLFTCFESWMVSEHRKRGFDDELLASTFSLASAGNGIVAILAGFVAQIAADISGDIGPFQLAIALTVVALLLILPWNENYGNTDEKTSDEKKNSTAEYHPHSLWKSSIHSLTAIATHPEILLLGLSQAFFEGGMYTFVFMWVPSLMTVNNGSIPTGLVFSAFMLAMTFGGMLYALLLPIFPGGIEALCCCIYFTAALSLYLPVHYSFDFVSVLSGFLVVEAMVGMFNGCGGTLRSRYYPESMQSSIMSVFRLPLNLLVVLGTKIANSANTIEELQFVFQVTVVMFLISAGLQLILTLGFPHQKKSHVH